MKSLTLDHHNRARILGLMTDQVWVVACLCAAWCGSCRDYRKAFDGLAASHPDKKFIWIDIEDQADVVGDIDVDNFPTLLIQRGDNVAFFGTVTPDPGIAERVLAAQTCKSEAQLLADATANPERRGWQECNLRALLRQAGTGND